MSSKKVSPLLASYPRARPELPEGWRDVYKRAHLQSRNGVGLLYRLTQRLEAWMHCRVAARSQSGEAVLEIGAGTLTHLPWENVGRVYDVVEPFVELFEHQPGAERVSTFFADIAEVPRERTYDRIISIATLEHVVDLPSLVAEAGLHLRAGGMLWGFAWKVSVAPWLRIRTGLRYGDLMRHEHVNGAREIVCVLRHFFFRQVRIRRFPTPWHHSSLYAFLFCRDPDLERCRRHLLCRDTLGR